MEPAAMLVGTFKIDIGGPAQIGALFEDESVSAARFEPDIQYIVHLFPLCRIFNRAFEEALVGAVCKPGVRSLLREDFRDPAVHALIVQQAAGFLVDEYGDRHTPGALTRYDPVGARLDHAADAVAPLRRHPFDLVDRLQRLLAQAVFAPITHGDEPLRRVAEDD